MKSNITADRVRDYWNRYTNLYLEHMTTFQAGLFAPPDALNPFVDNAIAIADRAGIREHSRVLDLGCGVCGPAIEIALRNPNVSFVCVTDCSRQIEISTERVASFSLESQIDLIQLDYHCIDELAEQFDCCLFLESFGYTLNPHQLLSATLRRLRDGGSLYIKDVCHRWHLSDSEQVELRLFNETYCYNTPRLIDVVQHVESAGFSIQGQEILTDRMYRSHSRASMFRAPDVSNELTEFGRRHFKGFSNLPIEFYELKAIKLPI